MAKSDNKFPDILKEYVGSESKKKIIKMAVSRMKERLFSLIPFLGWGPLGSITSYYITKGVIFIMDQTIIGAHIGYIYFDEYFDRKKVVKIIKKLKDTEKDLTFEQRKALNEELGRVGRDFIRLNV